MKDGNSINDQVEQEWKFHYELRSINNISRKTRTSLWLAIRSVFSSSNSHLFLVYSFVYSSRSRRNHLNEMFANTNGWLAGPKLFRAGEVNTFEVRTHRRCSVCIVTEPHAGCGLRWIAKCHSSTSVRSSRLRFSIETLISIRLSNLAANWNREEMESGSVI